MMAAATHIDVEPGHKRRNETLVAASVSFWQQLISSTSSQAQPDTGFWARSVIVFRKVRELSEIVAGLLYYK
ncbi:hypothetical protein V6N13_004590 [Hibiscus sabdariffa]|uniref:Uncharacterized protein n=1 Tax=Hibiscus sabdariffa TaxID=183260 RepID=A0ABR2RZI3_9ROSI